MKQICPFCGRYDTLVIKFDNYYDKPLLEELQTEKPDWHVEDGVCSFCLDQTQVWCQIQNDQTIQQYSSPIGLVKGVSVLPIAARLRSHPGYTGKGVTICFIDSDFYLHPDLVQPRKRVLCIRDITMPDRDESWFADSRPSSWHGTMTSVVCAGNGFMSDSYYKGLAYEADLVLLKVMDDDGIISGENIARAIEWAIQYKDEYNIRIINLSVTDDEPESYHTSIVSRAVEKAFTKGIVVVAASGNDASEALKPPANSPHAITVGGVDDHNTLNPLENTLYHSTFGETIDGFVKPDIIAPAIWLAAPILPNTSTHKDALLMFDLWHTDDRYIKAKLMNHFQSVQLDKNLLLQDVKIIRQEISNYVDKAKFISPHYQHVDGTSFAAPIVASVIAQMLEANPNLAPMDVRDILLHTARPIADENTIRQGYGLVQPLSAVNGVIAEASKFFPRDVIPLINYEQNTISFFLQRNEVKQAVVTGSFSEWSMENVVMQQDEDELWTVTLPMPKKGIYQYKYLINGEAWLTDTRNIYQEADGYNGLNSTFTIQ